MTGISTQLVGITAGVFTAISILPQLIKTIRKKDAGDISILMIVILLTGLMLWVLYGVAKEDIPIIVTNSFSFLLNVLLLIFRVKYGKRRRKKK